MFTMLWSVWETLKVETNKCVRKPGDFPTPTVNIPKQAGVGIRSNTLSCLHLTFTVSETQTPLNTARI